MKSLRLFLLAILLVSGIAGQSYSAAIPQGEDAKNGPAVWTIPVFNNSASTLNAGDVVVWDVSNSTGSNDNYVTTTTTADTYIVAGVIYGNAISASDTGTMAIHGVVPVNMLSGGNTAGGLVCSSGTAAKARSCTTDNANFGVVAKVTASDGTAFVYLQ